MNATISCAEAEELLGAYALDALPDDEAAQFRAHAAGCSDHAAKAAELRAVASTLAANVEDAAPPAGLRASVLAAVAREPQLAPAAPPRRIESAPSRAAGGGSGATPFWRNVRPLQIWGGLAAAIIAGLLIWNIALRSDNDDGGQFDATQATSVAALQANNANGGGTALYFAEENAVVVVADGIDQLDSAQTYQLWALTGDQPVSLGVMQPDENGHMSGVVPFDVPAASGIAITVEPAGGSEQPTSDPVFTADLAL